MRRQWTSIATLAACLLVAASACKQADKPAPQSAPPPPPPQAAAPPPVAAPVPFRVTAVTLGKTITADKKVAEPATAFAASDTIYASVASEGAAPSVALSARWTYEDGQLVNETAQTIAPTGPAATEFHITKASGWPTGKYKVEISANGTVVGAKEFMVN